MNITCAHVKPCHTLKFNHYQIILRNMCIYVYTIGLRLQYVQTMLSPNSSRKSNPIILNSNFIYAKYHDQYDINSFDLWDG